MYGHGVGHVKLCKHIGGVDGGAVVKDDLQKLAARVDLCDVSHVAVEDARARRAIRLLPDNVIVVARLHDAVALAEGELAEAALLFAGLRRVQRRLQGKVQRPCTRVAAAGGRQDLQFLRGNAHLVGQPRFAQLHHRFDEPHAVAPGEEEKVVRGSVFELRRHAGVDKVRVAHDHRLPGLAENIAQGDGRNAAAANEVGKNVARAHARQLVRVADQNEAAARAQRRKQRAHEGKVYHGRLVHDERVSLEGFLFPLGEGDLAGLVVPCHAEHTVNGLRLAVAQLAHALGGAARGRGKKDGKSHALEERDDGAHARRLARAGAAGEQQQLFLRRKLDGLTLERRVLHALLALDLGDDALHAAQCVGLVRKHRFDGRRKRVF